MPYLQKVTITFNTHGDGKDEDTILHVFVKNRRNNSSTPEQATDFISNLLAYQSHEATGPWDINPYLAFGENLAMGDSFKDPSTDTFEIPLRSTPIPLEEVILPVVNIHLLAKGDNRWSFDYTITFLFDDGKQFSASSNTDGVTGIILDQDNRNYSGICVENQYNPQPPPSKFETDPVVTLTQVCLEFYTHHDNKNNDTQLNVHIVNRLSESSSQDIAIGLDLLKGQEFPDPSTNSIVFSPTALPLASNSILLQDIVLPVVFINIAQTGSDRWIFDYRVTYTFSNGQTFSSQTNGIILDQNYHKYAGVYQGRPFPTVTPLGRPQLTGHPINNLKIISLSFLQKKLDEFINKRQGVGSQDPPIFKIRLHNAGAFGATLAESYYDLQSLVANPPPPGVLSPPGFKEAVKYNSSPRSLGQLTGVLDEFGPLYLDNINTESLTVNVDSTQPTPVTVELEFDCTNAQETGSNSGVSGGAMNFLSFSVRISLTLTFDKDNSKIDVMSWVPHITDDDQISEYILVSVVTESGGDIGGFFAKKMREQIFDQLKNPGPFNGPSLRDQLNSTINSWLLGGVIDHPNVCGVRDHRNVCEVLAAAIDGDNLEISYTGPEETFVPPVPPGWPSATNPHPTYDFSQGNLANIDHIVVLTMENRSFDQMLGYLSLPPERGGMGRKDVDGLKGTEFNLLNGTACPSFAFHAQDTIFAPDPPHDYESVHKAINGGTMDGFVQSYADEHGPAAAYRIMGYHTAINVPTYDVFARDFAIGHRWFASHPGPTFCNRFYELTGRLNIDPNGFWEVNNSSPLLPVFTPTIFDYLSAQRVSWKYFEHHYCFLRFFQSHTFDTENIVAFDDPVFGFVNLAKNGGLPSVTFIDPHFIELPPGGNCDGPPADVQAGQQLVQQVVEAVVTSPQWNKTLLIITYDEHGGFYDHVPPPAATRVSPESLGTYGVRVPAFVISPWVKGGTVFGHDGIVVGGGLNPLRGLHFDHTSILKTIARRFMSQNPPYMGARYAEAHDLSSVIGNELRPSQFLPFISYNFLYGASQKRLEIQGTGVTPGTILWQDDPHDTIAQQFSFEDAGDGHCYIRTHTGSLYVTADDSLGVKQDVKYPTDGSATAATNPDRQRWKLTSGFTVLDRTSFTIWNAAFPGKVLQPSGGSNNSGIPVVLGDPQATHFGVFHIPNPWQVTSPLLSSGQVVQP